MDKQIRGNQSRPTVNSRRASQFAERTGLTDLDAAKNVTNASERTKARSQPAEQVGLSVSNPTITGEGGKTQNQGSQSAVQTGLHGQNPAPRQHESTGMLEATSQSAEQTGLETFVSTSGQLSEIAGPEKPNQEELDSEQTSKDNSSETVVRGATLAEGSSLTSKNNRFLIVDPATSGRSSPFHGFPCSTPMASPNSSFGEHRIEDTPLGEGMGHQLVSNPPQISPLSEFPGKAELANQIEALTAHIEHFGHNFMHSEGWQNVYKLEVDKFSRAINHVLRESSKLGLTSLTTKCYALRSKLSSHNITMASKAPISASGNHSIGYNSLTSRGDQTEASDEHPVSQALPAFREGVGSNRFDETETTWLLELPQEFIGLKTILDHMSKRLEGAENKIRMLSSIQDNPTEKIRAEFEELKTQQNARLAYIENQLLQVQKETEDQVRRSFLISNEALGKCNDLSIIQNGQIQQICETSEKVSVLQDTIVHLQQSFEGPKSPARGPSCIPTRPRLSGIAELPSSTVNSVVTSRIQSYGHTTLVMTTGTHPTTGNISRPASASIQTLPAATAISAPYGAEDGQEQQGRTTQCQSFPGLQGYQGNISNRERSIDISVASDESTQFELPGLSSKGERLKRDGKNLKRMLKPKVDSNLTKLTVLSINKNVLSIVSHKEEELAKALDRYENSQNPCQDLISYIDSIISESQEWSSGMREKYTELDCDKRSLDKKLYEGLKRFSSESELNVFEFLRKFESFTEEQGSALERANLLYEQYLSKDIQLDLVGTRNDYAAMKAWLVKRFGDVKVIASNIIKSIGIDQVPDESTPYETRASYFRKLNSVLIRLKDLIKTDDMPVEDLEAHIYSNEFIERLLKLVPWSTDIAVREKLILCGEDTLRVKGKRTFQILSMVVNSQFMSLDGAREARGKELPETQRIKSTPKRKRTVHNVVQEDSSTSESDDAMPSIHHQSKEKDSKQEPFGKQFKCPCTMRNHLHEVGECAEFFSLKPEERQAMGKKKVCYTCLGPRFKCKGKCSNEKKVPIALICKECKEFADKKKWSPLNILYCKNKEHERPSFKSIITGLESWITGFDSTKIQAPVQLAAHLKLIGFNKGCKSCNSSSCECKPFSRSSPINSKMKPPVLNTASGEESQSEQIVREVEEDSFYVMQLLNLKGEDCLTFYDRGANQHLIDGEMAERIGAKVVCDKPARLGIVGGGQIWTEFGKYKLAIGPTSDGDFYEITAQGIKNVTEPFPKYDLKEINEQLEKVEYYNAKDRILPEYIGGQRVNLLIGIKETSLEPKHLFELPCGLGVYQGPLTDKFGSNLCYGGPHKLFSMVNKRFGGNFNHISIYFNNIATQYRNSVYPMLSRALEPELEEIIGGVLQPKHDSTLQYSIPSKSGNLLYPTPLTCADFEELGSPEENEMNEGMHVQYCCQTGKTCGLSIHKARVPLSKLKQYVDEDDKAETVNFRCSTCLKCKRCAVSDNVKMMSLQEVMEDEILEKSVEIDHQDQKVVVDLPFVRAPAQFLSKRHKGSNNYYQALKVYKRQCSKTERIKEGMRLMHEDLVKRGFMKRITDLNCKQQDIIEKSDFQHYMAWTPVEKPDSISTPVRLVVDPSMSGLNLILAKGSNKLSRIFDILIRSRCKRHIWTTDVSKLYNHLVLKDTALPYGLFLYHKSMDPAIEPEVYVMMVAWYGVTSSCNQSGIALEKLSSHYEQDFPLALPIIFKDRYVDDILTGHNDKEKVRNQIHDVREAIAKGGFPLKFIVQSGEKPCSEASADGETVKALGLKYDPVRETYGPGFEEVNFNRKSRGAKAPNPFPVKNPEDVSRLLSSKNISRRMVISKLAEVYDPIGLWEPLKLQLKLEAKLLNGIDWDVALEPDMQNHWKRRFQQFLDIPKMVAKRCIIPDDAVDPDNIRLVCLSDAAESAGGCTVYATCLRKNGTYSCQLLSAKSRMMKFSIPRNELEAIRLMAELASDVKKALGSQVKDIIFITDSTIAMSWCHNLAKKLRLFVFNRVSEIRRLIDSCCPNYQELPLYHVQGKANIADLLTKPHEITPLDLGLQSEWCNGKEWMKLPTSSMPLTKYSDLAVTSEEEYLIKEECFPEPYLTAKAMHLCANSESRYSHCSGCLGEETRLPIDKCYGIDEVHKHCNYCDCQIKFSSFLLKGASGTQALIDIIKFGYSRSLRIMGHVLKFTEKIKHGHHQRKGIQYLDTCKICKSQSSENNWLTESALNYFLRIESDRIRAVIPKAKLETFLEKDGIFYQAGRLAEERPVTQKDLSFRVFFDCSSIKTVLPVVLSDSDVFFAFVLHIHLNIRKHAGVEITLKEVMSKMTVLNNPRRIIQKIRKSCSRCRSIAKATLELEMAKHPEERTQIAPPFYACMADTVFGFKGQDYKRARKTLKIYALIVVCLLTSAVNILALEGLETQDVIQALERHSARYGVPAAIYVDNGTQLAAIDNVSYSLRDVNAQVFDSMGMRIVTSTAKSHEERGRVERKVRTMREMLQRLAIKDDTCMTALQWETLFSKLSSQINDLPMAKSTRSNFSDAGWDLLTPNRLLLGRNHFRSLEGSFELDKGAGATEILRRNQNLQHYFYQMLIDRLHHLVHRPLKWSKTDKVSIGDICVFVYNENMGMNKNVWKVGKIVNNDNPRKLVISFPEKITPGEDIKKIPKMRTIQRNQRQVCILVDAESVSLNSRAFLDKLVSEQ